MGPLCYRRAPMEKRYTDALADWFELRLTTQLNRIAYYFELCDGARTAYYIGGLFQPTPQADRSDGFQFAYNHRTDRLTVPDWAADAVALQLFPDASQAARGVWRGNPKAPPSAAKPAARCWAARFAASAKIWTPSNVWDATASTSTPSLPPGCYHKYDTLDYFRVDPCFGTCEDLRQLVHAAHARGMRVILDGVFNHVSSRHPFFQDVLARGPAVPLLPLVLRPAGASPPPGGGRAARIRSAFRMWRTCPRRTCPARRRAPIFCEVGRYCRTFV